MRRDSEDSKWNLERLELNPDLLSDDTHTGISGFKLETIKDSRSRRQIHLNIPIAGGVTADLHMADKDPAFSNLESTKNSLNFDYKRPHIKNLFSVNIQLSEGLPKVVVSKSKNETNEEFVFNTDCDWKREGKLIKEATFITSLVKSTDPENKTVAISNLVCDFNYNTLSDRDFTLSHYDIAEPYEVSNNRSYINLLLLFLIGLSLAAIIYRKFRSRLA